MLTSETTILTGFLSLLLLKPLTYLRLLFPESRIKEIPKVKTHQCLQQ